MKYKQRIVAAVVCPIVALILLTYLYLTERSGIDVKNWIRSDSALLVPQRESTPEIVIPTPICQRTEMLRNMTFDFIANELYELVNKEEPTQETKLDNSNRRRIKLADDETLRVIVVPHSHLDPGWIMPIDDYYKEKIRNILDNSVSFLTAHPDMTMIWVETVFLTMWWDENKKDQRMKLKRLIKNGQFEVVSGGWVAVDEALTHYTAVLDQLIEGHHWLKQTLEIFPESNWSIDPFGYSSALPYIWKKSGMKGMNVVRILQSIKDFMADRKMLTFKWRQPWDFKGKYDILTHAEPNVLFCIAESCGPDRKVCNRLDFHIKGDLPTSDQQMVKIDHNMFAKNLKDFAYLLTNQLKEKARQYKHNVILLPHGCDFRYHQMSEFNSTYYNMKRLMKVINDNKSQWKVDMKFGTLKEYFHLKNQATTFTGVQENTITGDFFPYSEGSNQYWTGFYITRPFDKRMIRLLQEVLRATEVITTFAAAKSIASDLSFPNPRDLEMLQFARRTHALMQHHDAITGTSTRSTTIDYERRMVKAMLDLQTMFSKGLSTIFELSSVKSESAFLPTFQYYQYDQPVQKRLIKITSLGAKIVFSNSYSQIRKEIVYLIVDTTNIIVEDPNKIVIDAQINPYWERINKLSENIFEIYFEIEVPPLGLAVYTLKETTISNQIATIIKSTNLVPKNIVFKNSFITATFSKETGALQKICLKSKMTNCVKLNVDWFYFLGNWNDAYVFNTNGKVNPIVTSDVTVVSGKILSQVVINHDLFRQVFTLYNGANRQSRNIHVQNIATLDPKLDKNLELIMHVSTDIQNKESQFYTDANGFQLIKRQTHSDLPTGGNFYPITSMAILEDDKFRLAVHSAQPHGVASLTTGTLQFMIERVPPSSGKGLPESVSDQKPAESKFIIQVERFTSNESLSLDNSSSSQDISVLPSVSNIIVNDELQDPVQAALVADDINLKNSKLQLIDSSLPCNVIFANFRNFISSDFRFLGTGLTFHKKPYSCGLEDEFSVCDRANVSFHNLFQKHAQISSISKMSLSHAFLESIQNTSDNIDIDPMELESYYITWGKEIKDS